VAHIDIKIIAFNDLHGNLEPPDLFIKGATRQ
jgi:2',3'-cyclic-nucleotide 2'-phosphodiesterase (5'-nucleotidase family)